MIENITSITINSQWLTSGVSNSFYYNVSIDPKILQQLNYCSVTQVSIPKSIYSVKNGQNVLNLYENGFVIVSDKLARLIGIGDDGDDYYYICQEMYPQTKPSWCTYVVGAITERSVKKINGPPEQKLRWIIRWNPRPFEASAA